MKRTAIRTSDASTALAVLLAALIVYGGLPSQNANYADDSLNWALLLTQQSGLINSHHLYLNALRWIYDLLENQFGQSISPSGFLAAYSAFWGACGLASLYFLLRLFGPMSVAVAGSGLCAVSLNYWAYSIIGDVYVPATALLVIGSHAFFRAVRAETGRERVSWTVASVAAFVFMTLHHQAYSVFVAGLATATLLTREGEARTRINSSVVVLLATAVISVAIYGAVFVTAQATERQTFAGFVSGYADSFDARPDQKRVSMSTVVNSAAGQARALVPYYLIFKSEKVTQSIQARFPYRNVYPYPYLVRSVSSLTAVAVALGAAVACLALVVLSVRGLHGAFRARDASLAMLLAGIPTALFFVWWEGVSDEFWIWSLPVISLLATKGATAGTRLHSNLLRLSAAGLFISTFFGAILLFVDPANDIDSVNKQYLKDATRLDLVVGFDEIQSAARARLAEHRQGFSYFNVFDRAFTWSRSDLSELEWQLQTTLARGGTVYVDPYVLTPPLSNLAFIALRNPGFAADRRALVTTLSAVDPARIDWVPLAATVPGYFLAPTGDPEGVPN